MFDISNIQKFLEDYIIGLVKDINDPAVQKQLKRQIESQINNISNPLVRAFARDYIDNLVTNVDSLVAPYVGLITSDPPNSVDISTKVFKETVNEKVDSLADKIKRQLEENKQNNSSEEKK